MKTQPNAPVYPTYSRSISLGMTKREEFAAMAMQGIISRTSISSKATAKSAVVYADALIKELNENGKT